MKKEGKSIVIQINAECSCRPPATAPTATARSGMTWHALAATSAMGTGSVAMNACLTDQ